jgi:hypothetical protein
MKKPKQEEILPSLSRVFGYIAVKELHSISDQVRVLDRLGYGNKEIAIICGTTPKTVGVMKAISKKKGR